MAIHEHIPVFGRASNGEQSPLHAILAPLPGEIILDVTLGLGGHALELLEATAPDGKLFGLDADVKNLEAARTRLEPFKERVHIEHRNFRTVGGLGKTFDIVFADLGLSSPHIDDPTRGFSHRHMAALDFRFDASCGRTAAELLHNNSEENIHTILREYGELRGAHRLAEILYRDARRNNLATTQDLKRGVEEAYGYKAPVVLPQVFQALRIAVNDELKALEELLNAAPGLLTARGRLGIISYHSLEDRAVKRRFRELSAPILDVRTGAIRTPALYTLLTKRPLKPSVREIEQNPRARSALFRAIRKESSKTRLYPI